MSRENKKIIVAGVGGQGVVFLTNILVEAAMIDDVPVNVSEIHGLSQRGGVVTSGIGLGEHVTGFTGNANVDLLIGLEPLETQRCLLYLHKNSDVVFGNYRIAPYSVNAEVAAYPDVTILVNYLKDQCREVLFIEQYPDNLMAVHYNIYLLGRAVQMKNFPFSVDTIEKAIEKTVSNYQLQKSLHAFRLAKDEGIMTK